MRFTTTDAAQLAGATPRQLRYWQKTKLVVPSGKATGWRSYTFEDIVALRTVAALIAEHCSLQTIRRAVAHLLKHFPANVAQDVLASLVLLTDGKSVYLCQGDKVHDVLSGQHVLWLVPVGRIIVDTEAGAKRLPTHWTETVRVAGQQYHLEISRDPEVGGFNVQCRELPGAIEQGETVEETIANGKAAIESAMAFMRRRQALRAEARRRA